MGLNKLLSFVRTLRNGAKLSEVKLNPGGGPNITAEHFSAPGDDSYPLPGDYVVSVSVQRSGGSAAVGYLDPKNDQKATAGDKRIYARNAAGESIVELWLKNDGTAVLENINGTFTLSPDGSIKSQNGNGSAELEAAGNFVVNGVTIDTAGNIITPASVSASVSVGAPTLAAGTSLTVASKEIGNHTHPAGTPPGNTGVNN